MAEFNRDAIAEMVSPHGLRVRNVNDNFQASWEDLRSTTDLEKCRILAKACDELIAAGYHAEVQLSYVGRDKTRVAYPSLWINRQAREARTAQVPGLEAMVAKAVAQAIAEFTKAPTVEAQMELTPRKKSKVQDGPAEKEVF